MAEEKLQPTKPHVNIGTIGLAIREGGRTVGVRVVSKIIM